MALAKETISLNVANGLDQKTDPKLIQPNRLAAVKNRRFVKVGRLDKRPGQVRLTREIETSYPNPLPLTSGDLKSTVSAFEDQLLLDNNGAFYAKRSSEDKWQFRSHSPAATITTKEIASPSASSVCCDAVQSGNFTLAASIYQRRSDQKLVYSLFESETGIYMANTIEVDDATALRCISINGKAHIIYIYSTSLRLVTIDVQTGLATSPVTLKNDAANVGSFGSAFDAVVVPESVLGPVVVCAYKRDSDINIFAIDENGSLVGSVSDISTGELPIDSISLFHDEIMGANSFTLAYATLTDVKLAKYLISTNSITADFGPQSIGSAQTVYNSIAQQIDPTTDNLIVFLDSIHPTLNDSSGPQKLPWAMYPIEASLDFVEVDLSGSIVTALSNYSLGLRLCARPFVDQDRQTILIPCVYDSDISSVYILSDFSRGREPRKFFSAAKWRYGRAQAMRRYAAELTIDKTGNLPSIFKRSENSFSFCGLDRVEIVGATLKNTGSKTNVPVYQVSLAIHTIELAMDTSKSIASIGETHLQSGAQLSHYDGDSFAENGFLVDPEQVWSFVGESPVITTFTDGTVSTPAITKIQFATGAAFGPLSRVGFSGYVTFDTPTTDYYIYFVIDGVGSDPELAGRTAIRAEVKTIFSPNEVAYSFTMPAGPFSIERSTTVFDGDTIVIKNDSNGSVAAPTKNGLNYSFAAVQGQESGLSAGSYQYKTVWKWVDSKGLVHRSASSPASTFISETSGQNTAGFVNAIVPKLTNRDVTNLVCEFYRTQANQTTFYLLGYSYLSEFGVSWPESGTRVSFQDHITDTALSRGQILYENGGVLPNYSPGQVRHISIHQGRVVVSTDDPTQLLYSKSRVDEAPIEFAIENEIRVLGDDETITGHGSLDDKLIIGKEESLYVVAGAFPNDLGTQGTLTQPQRIASDTGILDHSSIVVYPDGMIFKSKKGFYRLSRALQLDYIGQAVEDYNSFKVSKGVLDTLNNEIRYYHQDTPDCLVYNYLLDKWSVWDNHVADSACVFKNEIYRVENDGTVHKSTEGEFKDVALQTTYFQSEFELPWLKLKGLQDFQRIWFASILGDYKSPHNLQAKFYYDYNMTETDTYLVNSEDIKAGIYQWKIKPRIQKCQAIKIKYTEVPDENAPGQTGESVNFTDVSFDVGLKRGLNKVERAKRS